jgi:hypothetical protein
MCHMSGGPAISTHNSRSVHKCGTLKRMRSLTIFWLYLITSYHNRIAHEQAAVELDCQQCRFLGNRFSSPALGIPIN